MNQGQKQLVIWAIFIIIYIFFIAALHWWVDSDVFIIAIGLCGILFIGEYYHNVHFTPLDRSIGRLEGEGKALKKIMKLHEDATKRTKEE